MTKTRTFLLSVVGLVSVLAAAHGGVLRPVLAAGQESSSQPQQARPTPRRMDSHTALGLGRVPDAAAAKRGEPLYGQNCQACHGEGARGSIGPSLVRSVLVLHDDDDTEIAQVVRSGRPQAGMPPFKQLTDAQVHDIAEYLHQLIELSANRGLYKGAETMESGDAGKGKLYFAAHCASCHSVTGDLAGIGTKFAQPTALMARIAWPDEHGPQAATVVLADGRRLTGTLVHYDDFETTLKPADGGEQTWPTDTVKVEIPDKIAPHRALLPQYSDDDLHNLTRYLMTIK
ncbi:MAG: c-type cytochrome [Edaphobacter sp.]|uniref:c-type cytochrome n=1 Tax=Edaphobacter sp. TaxID=1934404 RepID=UPI0023963324|nr:c-type cytochrome [Edaphobacter sp.]MDE1176791.1 c-type cytochrome [Edaphobacter sp.]